MPSSGVLRIALILCCVGVLLLGVIPDYIIKLAELAAKSLRFSYFNNLTHSKPLIVSLLTETISKVAISNPKAAIKKARK